MARHAKLLLLPLLLLGIQNSGIAQSAFDADRVRNLLQSKRIHELRRATNMIRQNPLAAAPLIDVVARRANHPELTTVFRMLLRSVDESQLKTLIASAATQQKQLVRAEIESPLRTSGQWTPSSVGTPMSTSSNAASPANTIPATQSNTRTAEPRTAEPRTAEANAAGASEAEINAIEKRIAQLGTELRLTDEDWLFLFQVIDRDYDNASRGTSVYSKAGNVIARFAIRHQWDPIYQRFRIKDLKHPERLIPVITRRSPRPADIDHRIFELSQSDDPDVREMALRHFPYADRRSDEYAAAMLQWAKDDPTRARELTPAIAKCTLRGNSQTRNDVFRWILDRIEIEAEQAGNPTDRNATIGPSIAASASVIRVISNKEQVSYVPLVAARAEQSPVPMLYLRVFEFLSCDLSGAASTLRRMYESTTDNIDRLRVGKYLYRAQGRSSGVYPIFKKAILSPKDDTELRFGLMAIPYVGSDAKELVPKLIELLTEDDNRTNQTYLLKALEGIGPGAAKAVPTLIQKFEASTQWSHRDKIINTLSAVGPKAKDAIPHLIEYAEQPKTPNRGRVLMALVKIGPNDQRVKQTIQTLAESNDRSISGFAQSQLRQLESLRASN